MMTAAVEPTLYDAPPTGDRPANLSLGSAGVLGAGLSLTAYLLGVRHAFDADHIAVVDSTTRKLVGEGKRAMGAGFWFSLGHSSVVFGLALLLALGIRALVGPVQDENSQLLQMLGLFIDGAPAGVLGFADRVRPGARAAVSALAALTGRAPVLLTGDDRRAAQGLAAEVGITDVRARLLPAGKAEEIRRLEAGPSGGRREPGHRGDRDRCAHHLGPRGAPAAATGRRRTRGLDDPGGTQRAAPAALQRLAAGPPLGSGVYRAMTVRRIGWLSPMRPVPTNTLFRASVVGCG